MKNPFVNPVADSLDIANSFSQNDGAYFATDQVRARDADGLKLYDDGGNGIFVEDGGNVGIGTATPSQALTVEGNIELGTGGYLYGDTIAPYVSLNSAIGTIIGYSGTTNRIFIGSGALTFRTSSIDALSIDTNQNIGIGTAAPSSRLDIQKAGTAKANLDILELTNSGNAADMDATETSILFNQWYYDATTPAVADAGRITVGTETDWTSTAATQDSYMAFKTALDGVITEQARVDSSVTAGQTRFLIYDVDNATLERVTVGAADSGGSGFKLLRIAN